MKERDRETRLRLLSAAARLFAEHGFARVTVRDICQKAGANVAAVNYHFGGKVGLYHEVLQSAIRTMQSTTEAARAAGAEKPPDQQLRAYVQVFLQRVVGGGHDTWIHQLMMHELSNPTPALDMVLEQVIQPRMAYLSEVIAQLLGCPVEDTRVARCALSVNAQCLAVRINPMAGRVSPVSERTPEALDAMADHIARFSLAGIDEITRNTR